MDTQWAGANLYAGVTTLVNGSWAPIYDHGVPDLYDWPAPRTYVQHVLGFTDPHGDPVPPAAYSDVLGAWASAGFTDALLYRDLTNDQEQAGIAQAHSLGLRTVSELGITSGVQAAQAGTDALIHDTRYLLTATPDGARQPPLVDPPNGPTLLQAMKPTDPGVQTLQAALVKAGTSVIPTAVAECVQALKPLPALQPAANMLQNAAKAQEPGGMTIPRLPKPGDRSQMCNAMTAIDASFAKAGVKQIAGSAAPVFGLMPGIALQQELQQMVRIGLTPRQALASATTNPQTVLGLSGTGCLANGCNGDAVILNSDPTVDILAAADISDVVLAGKQLDRTKLITFPAAASASK